jgi:hypothetical protein
VSYNRPKLVQHDRTETFNPAFRPEETPRTRGRHRKKRRIGRRRYRLVGRHYERVEES